MVITNLKNMNKLHLAPERGYILAVFGDSVIFERYQRTDDGITFRGCEEKATSALTRLHLFDETTEYRLMITGSRGVIEHVVNEAEERDIEPDLIYEDKMLIADRFAKGHDIDSLRIINRYRYTWFDTLTLDDYRIAPGE